LTVPFEQIEDGDTRPLLPFFDRGSGEGC
ncbi:hypothetical protein A2U01_0104067, partial [Trifolium medium]|nr:hypothetical protein [Trifolium medium]